MMVLQLRTLGPAAAPDTRRIWSCSHATRGSSAFCAQKLPPSTISVTTTSMRSRPAAWPLVAAAAPSSPSAAAGSTYFSHTWSSTSFAFVIKRRVQALHAQLDAALRALRTPLDLSSSLVQSRV